MAARNEPGSSTGNLASSKGGGFAAAHFPGTPRRLRGHRSPAAKQLVAGLFDEVVSAHIAVTLPQLVPAFRATLPAERSGHALDNLAEHRCVLTNNTSMIPGDLT
jgi:hypothetical protein